MIQDAVYLLFCFHIFLYLNSREEIIKIDVTPIKLSSRDWLVCLFVFVRPCCMTGFNIILIQEAINYLIRDTRQVLALHYSHIILLEKFGPKKILIQIPHIFSLYVV